MWHDPFLLPHPTCSKELIQVLLIACNVSSSTSSNAFIHELAEGRAGLQLAYFLHEDSLKSLKSYHNKAHITLRDHLSVSTGGPDHVSHPSHTNASPSVPSRSFLWFEILHRTEQKSFQERLYIQMCIQQMINWVHGHWCVCIIFVPFPVQCDSYTKQHTI